MIKMRLLLIIFLIVNHVTSQDNNNSEESFINSESKNLDALFQQKVINNNAVGASAGYSVNGETKWVAASGFANRDKKVPFERETKLRMASIAKSMTAIAVMQLVEQNLIDLEAPIQNYIPNYPKQPKTQVTTKHLLSHTSGLDGYKSNKEAETQQNFESLADAVDFFKERPLLFEPGKQYSYTSYGYTVLGLIIEKVTGMSYEAYMQENIWDKAHMTNTGIDIYGIQEENESMLYRRNKRGKLLDAQENNLSNRVPGGGFYTTVDDLLKFGNAVINNDLIKAETFSLMRQHHSLEKVQNSYGFGWFLYSRMPNPGDVIGHSGGQTGSSSQLFIIPEKGIVTVVLANTSRASNVTSFAVDLLTVAQEQ